MSACSSSEVTISSACVRPATAGSWKSEGWSMRAHMGISAKRSTPNAPAAETEEEDQKPARGGEARRIGQYRRRALRQQQAAERRAHGGADVNRRADERQHEGAVPCFKREEPALLRRKGRPAAEGDDEERGRGAQYRTAGEVERGE